MKKKLLKALGSDQQILNELSEIKKILSNKDFTATLNGNEVKVSNFSDQKIPNEVKVSNFPKQEAIEISNFPEPVKFPEKIEITNQPEKIAISNFDDFKPIKVTEKVIDVVNPIKTLYKSIESLLAPFVKKFDSFVSNILQYIKEPDRTTITDDLITDYYGTKKVEYKLIRRYGRIKEIIRNEG